MKTATLAGSTSQIRHVFIYDSTVATGAGKTALAFGDITAYYVRSGGTLTALTLVDITTLGTWDTDVTSNKLGFKKLDDTNAPGVYEVHLPDNILVAGADTVVVQLRATGAVPCNLEIQLANVPSNTQAMKDGVVTAAAVADAAIDNATFAADVGSTAYATNIIALAVRKVLDELNLDHLLKVADSDDVVDNSVIGKLASTDGDWSKFVDTTDALQSIRDKLPANLEDLSVTDTTGLVGLQDDTITSAKFDETTAFPLAAADSGVTYVARAPSGTETLDTLATDIAAVQTTVNNIANVSAPAYEAPSSYTLTTGNQTSGTYASVDSLNQVYHVHTDAAGTLSLTYHFTMDPDELANEVFWSGRWNGVNDTLLFEVYDWVAPGWVTWFTQVGVAGTTSASDFAKSVKLVAKYTGTGADAGKVNVRISGSGLTSCTLSTDQLIVGKTTRAGGIANGSTVTLAATAANLNYEGYNWTLALGGQAIDGAHFSGCEVSGTGTCTSQAQFYDAHVNAGTTVGPTKFYRTGFNTTSGSKFTAGSAGEFIFVQCFSEVAGSGTPYYTFAVGSGSTSVSFRGYYGGAHVTLDSYVSGYSMECVGGGGHTVVTGGCASVEIRGTCRTVTLTLSGTEVCQCVGVFGPIAIDGTAPGATVRLYGVHGVVTNTSGCTVQDFGVSLVNINSEVDDALNTAIPGSPTANSINERIATLDDNYTTTRAGYLDVAISSRLAPTVAARTLDVTESGCAGIDWANIEAPTTTVALTGTTVGTITTYTGNTPQTGDSYAIVNGDHGLVSIQDDVDTVLTRLVGTILAGNHTAQSGDGYLYLTTNLGALGAAATALAPAATALSTATWTGTKAGYLDVAVSSRGTGTSTHSAADVANLILSTPANKLVTDASGYVTYANPAPPSASTVASQVRTELTIELTRIDAAITTRQATVANLANAVTMAAQFSTMIVADGAVYDFTAAALAAAPSGGSSLTAQEVRDAMKLAPTAGDPAAGSVDKHLDDILEDTGTTLPASIDAVPTAAEIDTQLSGTHGAGTWGSSATGTGARVVTFTVTTGGVALQGATVRLYRTGSVDRTGTTNASGQVELKCDVDATWSYTVTHALYDGATGAVVVDGNESVPVSLTATTFSQSDADKTTLWADVYDEDNVLQADVVITCQMIEDPAGTGHIYLNKVRSESSDANGRVQFTNCIRGATYQVIRGSLSVDVVVGTAATQKVTDFVGTE